MLGPARAPAARAPVHRERDPAPDPHAHPVGAGPGTGTRARSIGAQGPRRRARAARHERRARPRRHRLAPQRPRPVRRGDARVGTGLPLLPGADDWRRHERGAAQHPRRARARSPPRPRTMRLALSGNRALIEWVTDDSDGRRRSVRARRGVPHDDLRCHPDLCARLESAASGLDHVRVRYIDGMPLLVHPNGIVFALAAGTAWMALRLPRVGHGAVMKTQWGRRGLEGDWVDCDPWLTDLSAHEGTARLRGWTRAAYAHATELGQPRPGRAGGRPPEGEPRRA